MIIAHLPAGYLAARAAGLQGAVFAGFIVGAVAPDLDILWFYLVDARAHHHHGYLTHRPALWALAVLVGLLLRRRFPWALGLGALLHVSLDSIAGQIAWAWPFSDHTASLVAVQPTHDHWLNSLMAHWTFKVELIIVFSALAVLARDIWRRR